eukprot:TRINITY_DN14588_c0_g1_i1.p3 TRINITY_DN14588_c0_g1~~TRINITY_DN14588_c0_g1_i1.p3  ORF type:complete len:130 (-),score=4.14 TRINITY_DN14588_c0_g1_i1:309-698(-)
MYNKNMHIAEYWWGNLNNHDPRRDRKLLLTKKELTKLRRNSQEKGLTIVAYRLFLSEKGLAKLEIVLAKGRKEYDKRENLKQKDAKREMDRAMKVQHIHYQQKRHSKIYYVFFICQLFYFFINFIEYTF